jgi:hypothetical protein
MDPRTRADYSAIIDRPPLDLPDGARLVVWPLIAVESWDPAGPMARTVLSPPGGQTHLPDIPNWTWQEYGMRVGFWRLKAALDRHDIRATLCLNGSVCKLYPRLAGAARDAGWEFQAHSYVQTPMHLLADQRDAIRRTIDAIGDFSGAKPRGWIGPGLTETLETPELLVEEGIEYVGDWVWDDQPSELRTAAGVLYNIPYSVELNDIAIMLLQHHPARELYDRFMDQFERLYAEGAESARVMAFGVHPYITGVPHRIKYFERVLAEIAAKPGVLFWTGDEILDWYKAAKAGPERAAG